MNIMDYEILLQYIKPELVVLVVILYLIGTAIKNTKYIKDEFIPFILGFISICLAAIYILSTSPSPKDYREVLSLIFNVVIQGVCCAGFAVYVNQMGKQYKKLISSEAVKEVKNDTDK